MKSLKRLLENFLLYEDKMPPELADAYKRASERSKYTVLDDMLTYGIGSIQPEKEFNPATGKYDPVPAKHKNLSQFGYFSPFASKSNRRTSTWDYGAATYKKLTQKEALELLGFVPDPRIAASEKDLSLWKLPTKNKTKLLYNIENLRVILKGQLVMWKLKTNDSHSDDQYASPYVVVHPDHILSDSERVYSGTGEVLSFVGPSLAGHEGDTKYANNPGSIRNVIILSDSIYFTDEYEHPLDLTAVKNKRTGKTYTGEVTPVVPLVQDANGKLTRNAGFLKPNRTQLFLQARDPSEFTYEGEVDLNPLHGQRESTLFQADVHDFSDLDTNFADIDKYSREDLERLQDKIFKSISNRFINIESVLDTGDHQQLNTLAKNTSFLAGNIGIALKNNLIASKARLSQAKNELTSTLREFDSGSEEADPDTIEKLQKRIDKNSRCYKMFAELFREWKKRILLLQDNAKAQLYIQKSKKPFDEFDQRIKSPSTRDTKDYIETKYNTYSRIHEAEEEIKELKSKMIFDIEHSSYNPDYNYAGDHLKSNLEKIEAQLKEIKDNLETFSEEEKQELDKSLEYAISSGKAFMYVLDNESGLSDEKLQELNEKGAGYLIRLDGLISKINEVERDTVYSINSSLSSIERNLRYQENKIDSAKYNFQSEKDKMHAKYPIDSSRSPREKERIATTYARQFERVSTALRAELQQDIENKEKLLAQLESDKQTASDRNQKAQLDNQINALKRDLNKLKAYQDGGDEGIKAYAKKLGRGIEIPDLYKLNRFELPPEISTNVTVADTDDNNLRQSARDLIVSD